MRAGHHADAEERAAEVHAEAAEVAAERRRDDESDGDGGVQDRANNRHTSRGTAMKTPTQTATGRDELERVVTERAALRGTSARAPNGTAVAGELAVATARSRRVVSAHAVAEITRKTPTTGLAKGQANARTRARIEWRRLAANAAANPSAMPNPKVRRPSTRVVTVATAEPHAPSGRCGPEHPAGGEAVRTRRGAGHREGAGARERAGRRRHTLWVMAAVPLQVPEDGAKSGGRPRCRTPGPASRRPASGARVRGRRGRQPGAPDRRRRAVSRGIARRWRPLD